jgi:hypothetical protein
MVLVQASWAAWSLALKLPAALSIFWSQKRRLRISIAPSNSLIRKQARPVNLVVPAKKLCSVLNH